MSEFSAFNEETAEDRRQRRERAHTLMSGTRGADGLTAAEYALLTFIRRLGLEVATGYLVNERTGQTWQSDRIVKRAG